MAKKTTLTGEVRALMNAAENIRGIVDKVNATAKRSNYPTGAQRETLTSAQELINNICRLANFIINPDATDIVDVISLSENILINFDKEDRNDREHTMVKARRCTRVAKTNIVPEFPFGARSLILTISRNAAKN